MKLHQTIMRLIPEGESAYDLGEINCRCDRKPTSVVPTDKRLMTCSSRFLGFHKVVDDFSWSAFSHVKITQKFGSYTMELKFRNKEGSLTLEGITKENFDAFYRRIRERIAKYDEKYKISSKICPQCGEIIKLIAKQCPHCQTEFRA